MFDFLNKKNKTKTIENSIFGQHVQLSEFIDIQNSTLGDYVNVAHHAQMLDSYINTRTSIGRYSKIRLANIGKYCSISWDTTIGAPSHPIDRISGHAFSFQSRFGIVKKTTKLPSKKTNIGNDVWIGCNACILQGITVGHGAVIGAGAVVTKDVPPYSIVAGVPARIIRYRFSENICKDLLYIAWWDWPDSILQDNIGLFEQPLTDSIMKKLKLIKDKMK